MLPFDAKGGWHGYPGAELKKVEQIPLVRRAHSLPWWDVLGYCGLIVRPP